MSHSPLSTANKSLHKLELKVSYLLRVGVLVSGMLLCLGWLWMLIRNGSVLNKFSEYSTPVPFFESIQWALIENDRAILISFIGLIVLVALPVFRVFMTGVLFFWRGEYRLGFMALFVFIALVSSFFLGFSEGR